MFLSGRIPSRILIATGSVMLALFCHTANAQVIGQQIATRNLPGNDYYLAFGQYYQGEYRRAGNDFARGAQTALKFGSARFLDSCCYWTMNGECRFHLGDYAGAITQYEEAIRLYVQYTNDDWQSRVTQPQVINVDVAAVQRSQVNWMTPQRNVAIPLLPDSMQMLFGRLDAALAFQVGGVVANPEFRQVDAIEIMRTTAVALQRRRWIKGDVCQYDSFSRTILDALQKAGTGDASILSKCNLVLLGLALAGNGDLDRAREVLANSLQFGAGMDHPLTPIAMLELARIYYQTGDTARAASLAAEASFVAGIFRQYDIVEQALALGTEIHLRTNRSVYPLLERAIAWASRDRAHLTQVSLAIRMADCLAESGAVDASMKLLDDTQRIGGRTDILRGPLAGRLGYLRAVNQFYTGNFDVGRQTLIESLNNYAGGSRWLYQLSLVNGLVATGRAITSRQADTLYGLLLGDPQEIHWRSDPIEAMSYLASPHLPSIEAWLEIAIENRNFDRAVEIAELLRRHRFYASLPMSGRLMSMRWVMHGPDYAMDEKARAQRTDFMTRNPAYADLVANANRIRQALLSIPLQPDAESDREKEQRDLFVELMQTSAKLESQLASFSLRREPAQMIFPQQSDLSVVRSNMPGNATVLYIAATERSHWIFECGSRGTKLLAQHKNRDVATFVNKLMKEFSLAEKQITVDQLQNAEWRENVLELTTKFLSGFDVASLSAETGLVVVPDGYLWYLPFEVLLFGPDPETATMLGEAVPIRYSPTLALAMNAGGNWKKANRVAVFPGRMDNSLEVDLSVAVAKEITGRSTDSGTWSERLMIPGSLLGNVADQFVVLTQMDMPKQGGPFALMPVQKDIGRSGNNLAAWLALPMEGPDSVLLPAFDSNGSVGVRSGADGSDIFLTTMGLMASGTRTVMISRWPTRGQSALSITNRFQENLAKWPAVNAMFEAQKWMREQKPDLALEPRIKKTPDLVELTASHPFFWAGYMTMEIPVVDPPRVPDPAEKKADEAEGKVDGENAPDKDKAVAGEEKKAGGDEDKKDPDKAAGRGDGGGSGP